MDAKEEKTFQLGRNNLGQRRKHRQSKHKPSMLNKCSHPETIVCTSDKRKKYIYIVILSWVTLNHIRNIIEMILFGTRKN